MFLVLLQMMPPYGYPPMGGGPGALGYAFMALSAAVATGGAFTTWVQTRAARQTKQIEIQAEAAKLFEGDKARLWAEIDGLKKDLADVRQQESTCRKHLAECMVQRVQLQLRAEQLKQQRDDCRRRVAQSG